MEYPIKMSSDSTAINVPINSSLYKDLYPNLYSYDKSQDIYSAYGFARGWNKS